MNGGVISLRSRLLVPICALMGCVGPVANADALLHATDLRCEYQVNPAAIDTTHPRLSWVLQSEVRGAAQSAYKVLAASSLDKLARGNADLWNGTIREADPLRAVYSGKALHFGDSVWWKVQPIDAAGKPGVWSAPAHFEIGPLTSADWGAKWISDGKPLPTKDEDFYLPDPAPLFRRELALPAGAVKARLAISAAGYYEASINGAKIGDALLAPAWTNYKKRIDYSIYDVTGMLRKGANCIGVTLGNGWYNPLPLKMWGTYNLRNTLPVGRPRFIARLDVTLQDGTHKTLVSDGSWRTTEGPIITNSIYLGEEYDARKEVPGWNIPGTPRGVWRKPAECSGPGGHLEAQYQPPIRVTKVLPTKVVTRSVQGAAIYDLGQNFAGLIRLKVKAAAGTKIVLRYGELLHADGTLNPMTSVAGQIKGSRKIAGTNRTESVGGPGAPPIAWQTDTYICRGGGTEVYQPRFTFHGFRYVEVTGLPADAGKEAITGLRMNTDVPRVGNFVCSNSTLNQIQVLCDNTFLSNIFSVQSDCPHRERFGYGGDLVATCDAYMANYEMERFYAKSVRDWADAALPDGMLTDTAPFVGIQYCGLAWALAHPLVQARLIQYYGDTRLAAEQYPVSAKWLNLVRKQYPDGIVKDGLSDHETIAPTDPQILLTPLFHTAAGLLSGLARQTHNGDPADWQMLGRQVGAAYRKQFVDGNNHVTKPTQASVSFAIEHGVLSPEARTTAVQDLVDLSTNGEDANLTTGILGTNYTLDVMSKSGHGELALRIAEGPTATNADKKTERVGFKRMLDNGATTLWEHWEGSDNTYSNNHPMFGSVSQWICQWVGGIAPAEDAVGFNHILVHPLLNLENVSSSEYRYGTARGTIVCRWKRTGNVAEVVLVVPTGCTADADFNSGDKSLIDYTHITEGGKPIGSDTGVTIVRVAGSKTGPLVRLKSGRYVLNLPLRTGALKH